MWLSSHKTNDRIPFGTFIHDNQEVETRKKQSNKTDKTGNVKVYLKSND